MHIVDWARTCYGVATVSRIHEIIRLFCIISSLLQGSFAIETYNFKEPTNQSHPITTTIYSAISWRTWSSRLTLRVCVCVCMCVCMYSVIILDRGKQRYMCTCVCVYGCVVQRSVGMCVRASMYVWCVRVCKWYFWGKKMSTHSDWTSWQRFCFLKQSALHS